MFSVVCLASNEFWEVVSTNQSFPMVEDVTVLKEDEENTLVKNAIDVPQLERLVAQGNELVVVYPACEELIGKMFEGGNGINDVKAVALEFINKLTALFTAHRDNLTLINACELDYATDEGLAQVKGLGWDVNKKDTFYTATSMTVLASKLLQDDKELKRAKAKLEGCSFLLDSCWYDGVLSQALQFELQKEKLEARIGKESKKLSKENKTLKQSNTELSKKLEESSQESQTRLDEVLALQEQLEGANNKQEQLLKSLHGLFSNLHSGEGQVATDKLKPEDGIDKILSELTKSIDGFLADKRAVEIQRDKFAEKCSQAEQDAEVNLRQLLSTQEELEKLYSELEVSKNKVAEEIVAQGGSVSDNTAIGTLLDNLFKLQEKTQEELKIENSLALKQIMNLQEELEHYYHVNTANEKKLASLETQNNKLLSDKRIAGKYKSEMIAKNKVAERKVKKLEKQLKDIEASKVELSQQLVLATRELQGIKSSPAWKISKPVRKVTNALGKANSTNRKLKHDIGLLHTSELFDAQWYLETYPDVKDSEIDPAEHYLLYGASEGRYPSQEFDSNWYLERYPDVTKARINPLLHYIKFGIIEGRQRSPRLLSHNKSTKKK